MKNSPVFRITKQDIENLRLHVRDQSLIDAYSEWVTRGDKLDSLITEIENAFTGSVLGDGTGLFEAQGLDDYASKQELAELRNKDEHADWRCIEIESLNRCYAAITFMNARGFVFHLSAFLIAELNDNFPYDFIGRLYSPHHHGSNWMALLTDLQKSTVASVLAFIADHPDFASDQNEITIALSRLIQNAG